MERKKILLVEDDHQISKLLFDFLKSRGFAVSLAADGDEGIEKFFSVQPDIVLLDVMMPNGDGFSVLAQIRECSFVPVIMITARVDIEDRIRGLDAGADDYVCKPFSFKELESRILANLRYTWRKDPDSTGPRYPSEEDIEISQGGLKLNMAYHSCSYKGREIRLTVMQFGILRLLMEGRGRVLTRDQIGDTFSMSGTYESYQRTIDAHIKNLRRALQAGGCDSSVIETVRGVGYKFVAKN